MNIYTENNLLIESISIFYYPFLIIWTDFLLLKSLFSQKIVYC